MLQKNDIHQIAPYLWEIPKSHDPAMRVPARVYISEEMLDALLGEKSLDQLVNVASLPGIEHFALAMPDIHQGYGFPIGGVAALRAEDGVISPGGVGYDINCGVRLLASPYAVEELRPQITALANQMQRDVPSGVGQGGFFKLSSAEFDQMLARGVRWALQKGLAAEADLEAIEESGSFGAADAACVSERAKQRGADQLGTLGAGNHFLEIQQVVEVHDAERAKAFGLFDGQAVVMMHTGSRGLGHEVCSDYVRLMHQVMPKYGITIPDRELACAPFRSEEGRKYFAAMAAAANFAWTNRQLITHQVRNAWRRVLGAQQLQLPVVYDVAHNIAKLERYGCKDYVVHRKGATRAFGPGVGELAAAFRRTGQPVLIPGSMGTFSYVLAGTEQAMQDSFGSSCHGAGRRLSRTAAKKSLDYAGLRADLERYGVVVRAGSAKGLLEEAPQSYKNVDEVVAVVSAGGLATIVAKLRPLAVIKG